MLLVVSIVSQLELIFSIHFVYHRQFPGTGIEVFQLGLVGA